MPKSILLKITSFKANKPFKALKKTKINLLLELLSNKFQITLLNNNKLSIFLSFNLDLGNKNSRAPSIK